MKIKLPTFLRGLQRRLARTKRYKQLLDSVSAPARGLGRSAWVLSRPLYRFARFELGAVPRAQRTRALELQIQQWAPFPRPRSYLLWEGADALLWAWDADRVEAAMLARKVSLKSTPVIPETLLQQRRTRGVYLLTCMEGYEGQVWFDQSLVSSRWWPATPSAAEWINFQRDAGLLPEAQSPRVPAAHALDWAEKPWDKSARLERSVIHGGQLERRLVPVAALCLFGFTAWYGAQLLKAQDAISDRSAELQALTERAGPVMAARGQALESLSRINRLQAIDRYPDQLSLMAKVAESLPKDGTHLKEWAFVNGKLKIIVASPNKPVSSDYVKLLQSSGIFDAVQAAPAGDPNSLVLTMAILPQAEMIFAAAPTEAPARIGGAIMPPR